MIHPFYYLLRSDFANSSVKWAGQTMMYHVRAALRRIGLGRRRPDPAEGTF